MNFERRYWILLTLSIFIFIGLCSFSFKYIQSKNKKEVLLEREINDLRNTIVYFQNNYNLLYDKEAKYIFPINLEDFQIMTSPFGLRDIPKQIYTGGTTKRFHSGVDLKGYKLARIQAVADGVVIEHFPPKGWHNGIYYKGDPIFGGKIIIRHNDGNYSLYGHLSNTYVREGQRVKAGDTIGRQGNTGLSTGDHLHFEIWDSSKNPIQPFQFISLPE